MRGRLNNDARDRPGNTPIVIDAEHRLALKPLSLDGPDVRLVPLAEGDSEQVVRWRNDPRIGALFRTSGFTVERQRAWVQARASDPTDFTYAIRNRQSAAVGMIALYDIDDTASAAEFGRIIVDPRAQRRGYGRQATELILAFGFDRLALELIYANCLAANAPILALLRGAGFAEVRSFADDAMGKQFVRLECSRSNRAKALRR